MPYAQMSFYVFEQSMWDAALLLCVLAEAQTIEFLELNARFGSMIVATLATVVNLEFWIFDAMISDPTVDLSTDVAPDEFDTYEINMLSNSWFFDNVAGYCDTYSSIYIYILVHQVGHLMLLPTQRRGTLGFCLTEV